MLMSSTILVFSSCVQRFNYMDFLYHKYNKRHCCFVATRHPRVTYQILVQEHIKRFAFQINGIIIAKGACFADSISLFFRGGRNQAIVILEGVVSGTDLGKVTSKTPLAMVALISSFFVPCGIDRDLVNLP